MRVAFTVFGGSGWTGGLNYLRNLLSALAELPDRPVQSILFVSPETPRANIEQLRPYLSQDPVVVLGWSADRLNRLRRLAGSFILQRDLVSEKYFRQAAIDVVFQHAAWYGLAFPIPTLAWIADFQHKHLPQMFSTANNLKRDLGYMALSCSASRILLSSQDARRDCERFFPKTRGKTSVLPFCVQIPEDDTALSPSDIRSIYRLPERYFYMPNQLWKHKNHIGILKAVNELKLADKSVVVVASGNPSDVRNPEHPAAVIKKISQYGLEDNFQFLGLIPYDHIMPLMRGALAVINPSFFEGWSTTVEEAKSLGVPLILSDINVHHEQAGEVAFYFDPSNHKNIAACLEKAWAQLDLNTRAELESNARLGYQIKRSEFAADFVRILHAVIS